MSFWLERRRGGKEETAAREKQSGCGSMSKQEEREDGLFTEGETHEWHSPTFTSSLAHHVLRLPPGVREAGDVKLGPESPDRGAEAGATAAYSHAQPPPANVHSADGQCQNPGERGRPFAGAAGRQVKALFWSLDQKKHAALSAGLRQTEGSSRRRGPNPPAWSHGAPHEEMQIQDCTLGI